MVHIERICKFHDSVLNCTFAVDIARWYDGDAQSQYDAHKPFKAVATLVWRDKEVEVCALHGKFNREMYHSIIEAVIKLGAQAAFATRHGHRVEWDLLKYQAEHR